MQCLNQMEYEVTGLEDTDGHAKKCFQAKCVHPRLRARISYTTAKSKKEEKFSRIFLHWEGGGSHTIRLWVNMKVMPFFFFYY